MNAEHRGTGGTVKKRLKPVRNRVNTGVKRIMRHMDLS